LEELGVVIELALLSLGPLVSGCWHRFTARGRLDILLDVGGLTKYDLGGAALELDDLDAVREEATQGARQVAREQVRLGRQRDDQSFVVTDEQGQTVLTFPFKLAIRDWADRHSVPLGW
jgi:Domain of unknown function (DUF6894)